jgi:hypothetical protein
MRRSSLLILPLLLAACTDAPAPTLDQTLNDRLQNPLFAERYWDEMADTMGNLRINNDPLIQDADKAAIADRQRESAVELSRLARQKRSNGLFGGFIRAQESVEGFALLAGNMLYLSSDFSVVPGPSQYLYLTTDVDPRDVTFPNDNALNVGALHSTYGAQTYVLPDGAQEQGYRTLVLWDAKLERMYGFAQLAQ